jgi:hypothetical protein
MSVHKVKDYYPHFWEMKNEGEKIAMPTYMIIPMAKIG